MSPTGITNEPSDHPGIYGVYGVKERIKMKTGNSYFEDVILWHNAAGHPVRKTPAAFIGEDEYKSRELGMRLVVEEFRELCFAYDDGHYREIADGCGDLIWVVCGLMARLGLNLDAAWEEIRRTNWDKIGGPQRADGKILKPEGWKPPSMEKAVKGIPMGHNPDPWGTCKDCASALGFDGRCPNNQCHYSYQLQEVRDEKKPVETES
jgi:hypothetical protein